MRTFVIGDIHGAAKALEQCLERSGFDREMDLLITLGDICDGWPYIYECVEILLSCKNRIDIIGNHDEWFINFLKTGIHRDPLGAWHQGGVATAKSYSRKLGKEDMIVRKSYEGGFFTSLYPRDIPQEHCDFFLHQVLYYIDEKNRLFVHAGYDRKRHVKEAAQLYPDSLYWDRDLWYAALSCSGIQRLKTKDNLAKIYLGHTTCSHIDNLKPIFAGGVWNLDTGAGWEGKLTIMNVDTEEYFQSDIVSTVYPDDAGRR